MPVIGERSDPTDRFRAIPSPDRATDVIFCLQATEPTAGRCGAFVAKNATSQCGQMQEALLSILTYVTKFRNRGSSARQLSEAGLA